MALPPPRLYLSAAHREEDLMPKRGLVQLLLLFFRGRPRARWVGVTLACVALLGLLHGEGPGLKAGLAQSLRQSAWKHALAGEPARTPWPWDDVAPAANPLVPRLGLSAAVLIDADWSFKPSAEAQPPVAARKDTAAERRDPHLSLGDVAIGDGIAAVAADGQKQVYRVIGRNAVDPGQFASEGESPEADPHLLTCPHLDPSVASAIRLIIDAMHVDPGTTTAPSPEQKL
jgi:hypothetical protein